MFWFAAFLALLIGKTLSQDIILWEFGIGRLASGQTTLPLELIGTPDGGLSTTYLYQVVSTGIVVSRTIIASASGWVEHFAPTHEIQCNFFPSQTASGVCFDETQTNSGTPTPVVLAVITPSGFGSSTGGNPSSTETSSSALPPQTPVQTINATTSPTNSISTTTPTPSHGLSVGVIIGVTVAGTLALCVLGVLVWCLLRRRQRQSTGADQAELGMTTAETIAPFLYAPRVIPDTEIHTDPPPYYTSSEGISAASGSISTEALSAPTTLAHSIRPRTSAKG
ncbi:hypothetical protein FB446DRAFT_798888 [Lentinula raphanica]|nr:hypothetical protein FB446DRAFT_798888 [Lentinula raphanica]